MKMTGWLIALPLSLMFAAAPAAAGEQGAAVEALLSEIRQDQPVPRLDCLKPAPPVNVGSAYFRGVCRGIEVTVETHPDSVKVASILLKLPGADLANDIVPAVVRVLGPPHHVDRRTPSWGWAWKNYRTASVHYAGVGRSAAPDRIGIVSLFYQ